MDTETLEKSLLTLETYLPWVLVASEQQLLFNQTPDEIDPNNRNHLNAQLNYVQAKTAQLAARQVLTQEIATQDNKFMPLVYRLGAIAAFNATKDLKLIKGLGARDNARLGLFTTLESYDYGREYKRENGIRPSLNPIARAVQIGDELKVLNKIFNRRVSVPVLMIWNHNFIGNRIDYDEVVLGVVKKPRDAWELSEPEITDENGEIKINHNIATTVKGVEKVKVIVADEYVQDEGKYKEPEINRLIQLLFNKRSAGLNNPHALYIGSRAVNARRAEAIQAKKEYKKQMEALDRIPMSERLY